MEAQRCRRCSCAAFLCCCVVALCWQQCTAYTEEEIAAERAEATSSAHVSPRRALQTAGELTTLPGSELALHQDGLDPLNEPCYTMGGTVPLCVGWVVCCVSYGTCTSHGGIISSNPDYYEGGCQSLSSSDTTWDAPGQENCQEQGECNHAYLSTVKNSATCSQEDEPSPVERTQREVPCYCSGQELEDGDCDPCPEEPAVAACGGTYMTDVPNDATSRLYAGATYPGWHGTHACRQTENGVTADNCDSSVCTQGSCLASGGAWLENVRRATQFFDHRAHHTSASQYT
eukprot:COSAG06_NODE_2523_length_6725_cov_6.997736_3_plen_288_part_00